MKICSKCKQQKSFNCFNKQTKSKDGFGSYCKECIKKYRADNPEIYSNALKRHRNKNRSVIKQRSRIAYEKNRLKEIERSKKYNFLHKEERCDYQKNYKHTINGSYATYKSNAIKSKRVWELSKEEFKSIVSATCSYCNDMDPKGINGIDRIDNSIGYTKDNSASCCSMCNYMKKNYSKEQFLDKIQKIYTYRFT